MPREKHQPGQSTQRARYAGFLDATLEAADVGAGTLSVKVAEMSVWEFRRPDANTLHWFETGEKVPVTNFSLTQDLAEDTFVRVMEWESFCVLETWECDAYDLGSALIDPDTGLRYLIIELPGDA